MGCDFKRSFTAILPECPLPGGDLNWSMQHLDSKYREEDVADEAKSEDLLQRRAEKLDVGSLTAISGISVPQT